MPIEQIEWSDVNKALRPEASILLGNGFSISFDSVFQYQSLLSEANISPNADSIFKTLNTTNFERVLSAIDQSVQISQQYGCVEPCIATSNMQSDLMAIKQELVNAISKVHSKFPDQKSVDAEEKLRCARFLKRFKYIYTLNYDFLLYWVWMKGLEHRPHLLEGEDGFRGGGAFKSINSSTGGIRFLHGGLHLYNQNGLVMKQRYSSRSSLLKQVEQGLNKGNYPIFIAEGSSSKKLQAIRQNVYLKSCFDEFAASGPDLVIFGSNLSSSDKHLIDAISENKNLANIYVSSHGNLSSHLESALNSIAFSRRKKKLPLDRIAWFDTTRLNIWRQLDE